MKIGDIVSIERPSIGVPKGTLALITEVAKRHEPPRKHPAFSTLFRVQVVKSSPGLHPDISWRKFYSGDLKVIHEA
jgi:hypothetical protein